MSEIDFAGRVVLITGAGKGLGRAYARYLARLGAKLVVNNRKREPAGEKGSADLVVEEIIQAGGEAVANYESVESAAAGERMVEQALDTFGRLDVLINNAGVDREAPLHELDLAAFEAAFAINFHGSVYAAKAALPAMRRVEYGRIILSTSSAGLHGLHGMTEYSSSKAALIGFTRALDQEGRRHGIRCNAIAPYAYTPMTAPHLPDAMKALMDPDLVAPMVAWLTSDRCDVGGEIYTAGMGAFRRAEVVEGAGLRFAPGEAVTPEAIASRIDEIRDLARAQSYPDALAAFQSLLPETKSKPPED